MEAIEFSMKENNDETITDGVNDDVVFPEEKDDE